MMPQTDPRIEKLLAAQAIQEQAAQDARNAEERASAERDLAAHDAQGLRELPAEERAVAELRAVRERADAEYIARAATLENKTNGRPIRRRQITDVLARTMPRPWLDARAELQTRIVAECDRLIPPGAEDVCDDHVRALQAARDQLDGLIECPAAEIEGRIAAILAAIPPRYDGGAIAAGPSWIEQQAANIRQYLADRFANPLNT